uniref:Gla-like protein n=1 Tax=Halocynthia roretzi TaxID=7729 RepID=Q8T6I3_HALRO|nr:gla-like protein [Halocynthia roretzi]
MPNIFNKFGEELSLDERSAKTFLSRRLQANTASHFEEIQQGNLERECYEELCSFEEAREVFETNIQDLNEFWAKYTGVNNNKSEDNVVGMIIGIMLGVLGFIILIIAVYVVWKKRKGQLDREVMHGSQPYAPFPIHVLYPQNQNGRKDNHYERPIIDAYDSDLALGISECYLERERLQIGELITSGNFGEVHEGQLRMRDGTWLEVAVKNLITLDDKDDIEKFLREGVMMRGLDHKNVLALIGVCVEDDDMRRSPLIVLPFMKHGDLRTFLRDGNNVLTVMHLLTFCSDVAHGMQYLAEKKFVHRDLAARNCMVNESWCVKVADFGLSRDLFDRDYYTSSVKTQLPLKWMPPESIKFGRYDEKSDVWAYGIVCWEIMTRGAIPYPTVQAVAILQYLSDGNRMEKPECSPSKLYSVMKSCWEDEPQDRPTFKELVQGTNEVLKDARRVSGRRTKGSNASSSTHGGSTYHNSDLERSSVRRDRSNGRGREEKRQPKPKPRTKSRKDYDGGRSRESRRSKVSEVAEYLDPDDGSSSGDVGNSVRV